MPCYHPKDANAVLGNKPDRGEFPAPVLNCGKCHGCKRERARQWTIRLRHEHSLHDSSSAITLTYDQDNLPAGRTLLKRDFQQFLDRLRARLGPFRYFMCGEYGEKEARPHYHAVLFGHDWPDRYEWMHTGRSIQYRSPLLETLWTKGFSTVGDANYHSLAYVAGYVQKKIYAPDEALLEYGHRFNDRTGEITKEAPPWAPAPRLPPYQRQSLRPAIGRRWIERFHREVYPSDTIVLDGREFRPPRYYDKWIENHDPDMWYRVRKARYETQLSRPTESRKRLRQKGDAVALKQQPFEERTLE